MTDKTPSQKQPLKALDIDVKELAEALRDTVKAEALMKARGWTRAELSARAALAAQQKLLIQWDEPAAKLRDEGKALIQWDTEDGSIKPGVKRDGDMLIQWDTESPRKPKG